MVTVIYNIHGIIVPRVSYIELKIILYCHKLYCTLVMYIVLVLPYTTVLLSCTLYIVLILPYTTVLMSCTFFLSYPVLLYSWHVLVLNYTVLMACTGSKLNYVVVACTCLYLYNCTRGMYLL